MYTQRHQNGISYHCIFPIVDYTPSRAAVRTLGWYVAHLNRQLDPSRYAFILTHTECLLTVNIKKSEWMDRNLREMILHRAGEEVEKVKQDMYLLSIGSIPDKISVIFSEEVEGIRREWYT